MNLNVQNTMKWSQNITPNTIIGGIAKTGGTGVNAPINTAYKLAQKLLINVNRIMGFKVVGDNVQCRIKGTYLIPDYCFGNLNTVDANQNITSYQDLQGLVNHIGYFAFRRCANFASLSFSSNINFLGNSCFAYTSLVDVDLSYLNASVAGEWTNVFNNCALLENVNTGNLGFGNALSASLFLNCVKLITVETKVKYYSQMFRNAGEIGSNFYNEFVIELRGISFAIGCRFETIELPNCIKFSNEEFNQTTGTRRIKNVIATKVVSIGVNGGTGSCFRGQNVLDLVDIRACKYFYGRTIGDINTYNFRDACKAGTVVKVHEFMLTSNAGSVEPELTYLKTTRGATVEFYNDLGVYVSTL